MTTITLPKSAYSEILKHQERADALLTKLQKQVEELARDDLRPEVSVRVVKQSRLIDAGKGIKLKNMKEYRALVRSL